MLCCAACRTIVIYMKHGTAATQITTIMIYLLFPGAIVKMFSVILFRINNFNFSKIAHTVELFIL